MVASVDILSFEVERQAYGIPASSVIEIVRAVTVRPLPRAPDIIEGVFDLRGRIVPVIDFRARFGLPRRPIALFEHLVVALAGERVVALRADRAVGLLALPPAAIAEVRALLPTAERVTGIASLPDGLLFIHDLSGFLSAAEGVALDGALAEADAGA